MSHNTETRRSLGRRHEAGFKVCAHHERKHIEDEWCGWASTSKLAKAYGLPRDSIYCHVAASELRERCGKSLRAALERIIGRADEVTVNAGAMVQAIQAFAKIHSAGQWVDRTEQVSLNDLFARTSAQELEAYARDGSLPEWFTNTVGATLVDGQEDKEDDLFGLEQTETA